MRNTHRVQTILLLIAGAFLGFYALSLTFSPAGRTQFQDTSLRWDHWPAFGVWALVFTLLHLRTVRLLPDRDPVLLPVAALLSGWGLMSIWRLAPVFGQRQVLWLLVCAAVLVFSLQLPSDLSFLRRYKYVLLTGGLLLTALTLLVGTNPSGNNLPRLWLGGTGIYLQPSEPLKLLLVVYLAAYLSGGITSRTQPFRTYLLPLLAPTLIMTGFALLLLIFQRDLGTASIFLFIYASMVYLASRRKAILFFSLFTILAAAVAGYILFDVVRLRVDAWLNPWLDPSGRSYQIVQSLLAIANGGIFGRGPGLGSPGLVPVPHSDFIYAAIVEESGLMGAIGLLLLLGLLAHRGLRIGMQSPDPFRRYLAAGLTAHLVGQSILIIGGNIRLLPLTGVTLPFVSYGGSSLLTSFLSLAILLHLSTVRRSETVTAAETRPFLQFGGIFYAGLLGAALVTGWWSVYRGPDLLTRTDNPRRAIADRYVRRGAILDRHGQPVSETRGTPGNYIRYSHYPPLAVVIGYNHPIYGQSGLEASLDSYLRGTQGSQSEELLWSWLIYGQPPGGVDIRLTLDLELQRLADNLLVDKRGALVVLNPETGQILAVVSHPGFDPNQLEENWADLIEDPQSPLLNRATLGEYQPGTALGPFWLAAAFQQTGGELPELTRALSYSLDGQRISCVAYPNPQEAPTPAQHTWGTAIEAGCPGASVILGQALESTGNGVGSSITNTALRFGLYHVPEIRLPAASSPAPDTAENLEHFFIGQTDLLVSPLQLALASAAISSEGRIPAPRLVEAYQSPEAGWIQLPALGESSQAISAEASRFTAQALAQEELPAWQSIALTPNALEGSLTWYLGGSLPDWEATPVVLALVLEENNPAFAIQVGQQILREVILP